MTPYADIVLINGRVLTTVGTPTALAVAGGKVLATGSDSDIQRLATKRTTILDCAGRAVIPGIVDAHCHVLASAAASLWVDCRPAAMQDISTIVEALRRAAAQQDNWIRGYGYDDSPVGLGRHLNRYDLDRVSTVRPVRVEHRSGHACVLNSCGLAVGRDRPSDAGPSRRCDCERTTTESRPACCWKCPAGCVSARENPKTRPRGQWRTPSGISVIGCWPTE